MSRAVRLDDAPARWHVVLAVAALVAAVGMVATGIWVVRSIGSALGGELNCDRWAERMTHALAVDPAVVRAARLRGANRETSCDSDDNSLGTTVSFPVGSADRWAEVRRAIGLRADRWRPDGCGWSKRVAGHTAYAGLSWDRRAATASLDVGNAPCDD